MKLLLVGGITSQLATLKNKFGQKYNSDCASIDLLDFTNKSIESVNRYVPPLEIRSEELGKDIRYTSASLKGNYLYACTTTQIRIYNALTFELVQEINHPSFNDVHHVDVINNKIVAVNTGLDSIMIFNKSGIFEEIISTNKEEVWSKFDVNLDYRRVASTKPHINHPNFVFEIEDCIWVTRFHQMDAVELGNPKNRINIGVGKPHDGHVYGDFVYFTTVNGFIVVANKNNYAIEEIIDLNEIDIREKPLGWCRSICLKDDYAYVGFTRLRRTKIETNLRWLREKFTNIKDALPARIAKYDLNSKRLLDEFIIPKGYTDLIFSIIDPKSSKSEH